MKIQNFTKMRTGESNNIHAFGCVISGQIEMTAKEWEKAKTYLKKCKPSESYRKAILLEDLERTDKYLELYNPKRITWRNVRVDYTQKLFKHYDLPRYKQQNYVIKIIKN